MAETDGTPRYRKSKPPKGAAGRSTRPSARAKKRADQRDTLPNGTTHAPDPGEPAPSANANSRDLAAASSGHVVRTSMPTVIRSDRASDASADTHAGMRGGNARATAPLAGGTPGPQPRTIRSALGGSTLRMELSVHKSEHAEPRVQLRTTTPLGNAGRSETDERHAADPANRAAALDGGKRSRKPTQPGFAPAFPDPSAPTTHHHTHPATEPGAPGLHGDRGRFDHTLRRGGNSAAPAHADAGAASVYTTRPRPPGSLSATGNAQRPRRPPRPGERTLIMSRRVKHGSKRDWVFVVLLVAALGLTASMFLSQQSTADEVVDASAYDDPQDEALDPFAPTTLRPWNPRDTGAAEPLQPRQNDTNALTAREPSAANSVQATELRSVPSGAEVVAGNAVVGSTPVRVARGSTDLVYVLRLAGHEPKVVRVGPNSPGSIVVELPEIPAPTTGDQAPAAPSSDP